MKHENKKFLFQALPTQHTIIKSAYSIKMFPVAYRLVITAPAPSLWYKDQGGKENCIEIPVSLVDSNGQLVKTRRVPLKLVMYYESGVIVPRQDFLKIMSQSSIGEAGEIKLRVRIEEVSRGHQKQNFVIRVSPDTVKYPLNNDISSADSTPIDVMSKPRALPAGTATTTTTTNATGTNSAASSSLSHPPLPPLPGQHHNNNHHHPTNTTNGVGNHQTTTRKRVKDEDFYNHNNHNHDTRPTQMQKLGFLFFYFFTFFHQI